MLALVNELSQCLPVDTDIKCSTLNLKDSQ
jgi:hypothetical protein